MRQLGSEIRRCNVAASDMTEGLRLEDELRLINAAVHLLIRSQKLSLIPGSGTFHGLFETPIAA
jgi:hypothetical protein